MAALDRVELGLAEMKSRYQQGVGQLRLLERQAEEKRAALDAARRDIEVWQKVQALLTKTGEYAREQLKRRIEETVTTALRAVFADDNMEFRVAVRQLGGQAAAEWQVVSCYGSAVVAANPEDARGGGITDIVSLALRLALLELARPKPQGPVILDEPAKMVSREYLPNLAEFLKQYARTTGRQIIMVTHAVELAEAADAAYRVAQQDGISEVSLVA